MADILFKDESYRIIGASFEVYNEMGCGFLEAVYQECLVCESRDQNIPFVARQRLPLKYKHHQLETMYEPDFVCFDSIVIELKAAKELCDEHRAQVHNYLKATGYRLGLLVNFGQHPKLEYERIVK
jgi:GxxExxY protein